MGVWATGGHQSPRRCNEWKWLNSRSCATSSDPIDSVQDNTACSKHYGSRPQLLLQKKLISGWFVKLFSRMLTETILLQFFKYSYTAFCVNSELTQHFSWSRCSIFKTYKSEWPADLLKSQRRRERLTTWPSTITEGTERATGLCRRRLFQIWWNTTSTWAHWFSSGVKNKWSSSKLHSHCSN